MSENEKIASEVLEKAQQMILKELMNKAAVDAVKVLYSFMDQYEKDSKADLLILTMCAGLIHEMITAFRELPGKENKESKKVDSKDVMKMTANVLRKMADKMEKEFELLS